MMEWHPILASLVPVDRLRIHYDPKLDDWLRTMNEIFCYGLLHYLSELIEMGVLQLKHALVSHHRDAELGNCSHASDIETRRV
ncbi:hypothetical protein PGIGA_G00017090 [Pangasianodon gigas]|uniref:Uncharacterized protein n=1 Tax=Pangasianodon gigas TaxID=30993 RepID=A0ACC5WUD7_PANGG|nr:hypothetical protein [Pangasianodon gigas]